MHVSTRMHVLVCVRGSVRARACACDMWETECKQQQLPWLLSGQNAAVTARPRCNNYMPETLPKMLLGNSRKPCPKCSQTVPKMLGKCSLFCHPQHTPRHQNQGQGVRKYSIRDLLESAMVNNS